MPDKFSCLHSGKCCTLTTTQINITFGDINRLSDFTNIPVRELFEKKIIGLQPFPDPEHPGKFDVELGLNIPCHFRVGKKCTVYNGRPLNCRMFPYNIISQAPKEKWKEIFDDRYQCVHSITISDETKKKYGKYAEEIGNAIIEESETTDKIMEELDISYSILRDPSKSKSMDEAIEKCKSVIDPIESHKLKLLVKKIDENKQSSLKQIEESNRWL